jgi:hypothetical protein
MMVNGPGTLIIGGGIPTVVLLGRVLPPSRQRAAVETIGINPLW